jgi:tetratricopeptide (TPR) repeat protein
LFKRYIDLERRLKDDVAGWEAELDQIGRPVILVDHEYSARIGATLLRSARWRCVWFDAIAAVFLHDSHAAVIREHAVDFAARHFRRDRSRQSRDIGELTASAKAMRKYVTALAGVAGDLARPLVWLGLDDARGVLRNHLDSSEAWKDLGLLELFREPPAQAAARFRARFDPVLDLSLVRATYALRRALELAPHDSLTLLSLRMAYDFRSMHEQALPLLARIERALPGRPLQALEQVDGQSKRKRVDYIRKLGSPPATTWRNLSELDQIVTAQLASGRVESAAQLLEQAHPTDQAPWEIIDRIATLRLHLGEPVRARELWRKALAVQEGAIRDARIGTTYLVEGDFDAARGQYRKALEAKPDLFEACYCLAVLEQDAGDAPAAYELARTAARLAPDEASRTTARVIAAAVARFARRTGKGADAGRALPATISVPGSP